MAVYTNDLRLKEITVGDEDGTWGTSTNTNLSLIADGFSYGTLEVAADANETFTIPDGTADASRGLFIKFTSAGSLTATRTLTLAPTTVSKLWFIENATTGSQIISIKQGSGAEVTIAAGATKVVYTDGAGATGAVVDALAGYTPTATDSLAEVLALGNTTGANDIIVTAGQAITTDTISETTAASGVTIDSVLLKDNTVLSGTLLTAAGSITDSSGAISFGNENLVTTGDLDGKNITASGTVNADGVTDSTSSTTGTIITGGGLGVAKAIFSGSSLNAKQSYMKDTNNTSASRNHYFFERGDGTGTDMSWSSKGDAADGVAAVTLLTGSTELIEFTSAGAITTTGTAATGALTVTGVTTLNGDLTFSNSQPEILGGDTNGFIKIGPEGTSSGARMVLYGSTHASSAYDIIFWRATNIALQFDYSADTWDFQGHKIATTDSISGAAITGTGILSIDDTTDSTSTTTGSIHTDGGLGVAKDTTIGGQLALNGATPDAARALNISGTIDRGIHSEMTGTGSTSYSAVFLTSGAATSNYGLYSSATNGTNNYALYAANGDLVVANGTASIAGNTIIGSTSVTPDGTLHVYRSSAGVVTANAAADEVIIEGSGDTGLSILAGSGNNTNLYFGEGTDNNVARLTYAASASLFAMGPIKVGATTSLRADNDVTNLTLSGASGSELATFAGAVGVGASIAEVWHTSYVPIGVGAAGRITSTYAATAANLIEVGSNFYRNSGNAHTYIFTDEATRHLQQNGAHTFSVAASGTADTTITWIDALVIDVAGDSTFAGDVTANGDTLTLANNTNPSIVITSAGATTSQPHLTFRSDRASAAGAMGRIEFDNGASAGSLNAQIEVSTGTIPDSDGVMVIKTSGTTAITVAEDQIITLASDLTLSEGAVSITDTANETALTVTSSASSGDAAIIGATGLTTGKALYVYSNNVTTGNLGYFYSNSTSVSTRSLVKITNDNTLATSTTGLEIQQDAAYRGLSIDQNGNHIALFIDSEATTTPVIQIKNPVTTTSNVFEIANCDALTTGKIAYLYSNSASTGTRNLVEIVNDNTAATGTTALFIQQDSHQNAISIDMNGNAQALAIDTAGATGTGRAIEITADSLTTGSAFYLYSNSSSTGTRNLAQFINDNPLATGATPLSIQQDAAQRALFIDQNGNGVALAIDHNGNDHCIEISSPTSTTMQVIDITAPANTTAGVFRVNGADALTTGGILDLESDSASTGTRSLIKATNNNTLAVNATVLELVQDAAQTALFIDQNGNGSAISIDTESTTATTIDVDMDTMTSGHGLYLGTQSAGLTTGRLLYVFSNSTGGTESLAEIHNTNTAATSERCLKVVQDAARHGTYLDQNGDGQALYIDTEATTVSAIYVDGPKMTTGDVISVVNADSLTTGSIINAYSNSASTGTRNLVEIVNDNSSATGATGLSIQQDAAQRALFIDQNGDGYGIQVDTESTTKHGVYVHHDTATTGSALYVTQNSSSTGTRNVAFFAQDHASAVNATVMTLQQDAAQRALFIDMNGNGVALEIDSEATTTKAVTVVSPTSNDIMRLDNSHASTPNGLQVAFSAAAPNDATQLFITCADSSAARFQVRSNGGIANFQSNDADLSDQRVKTELTPLESTWDKVKDIEVGSYRYLDQNEDTADNIGVIAQQVLEVAPELVEVPEDEDELLRVFNKDLYFTMLKALQEAQARIEALEAKV